MITKKRQTRIFQTRVAGVSYEDRQTQIVFVDENTPIHLKREADNPHDSFAVSVNVLIEGEERKIGYLPKEVAKEVAPVMDAGEFVFTQFIEKKVEQYQSPNYEQMDIKAWEFTGVIIGIIY